MAYFSPHVYLDSYYSGVGLEYYILRTTTILFHLVGSEDNGGPVSLSKDSRY